MCPCKANIVMMPGVKLITGVSTLEALIFFFLFSPIPWVNVEPALNLWGLTQKKMMRIQPTHVADFTFVFRGIYMRRGGVSCVINVVWWIFLLFAPNADRFGCRTRSEFDSAFVYFFSAVRLRPGFKMADTWELNLALFTCSTKVLRFALSITTSCPYAWKHTLVQWTLLK